MFYLGATQYSANVYAVSVIEDLILLALGLVLYKKAMFHYKS